MKKTIFRTVLFVYIYLRVSTEEQARDAYGLQSQEQACREFCQKRGWIVKEVFCDRGVSAWSDVKRPEFVRMMKAIQKIATPILSSTITLALAGKPYRL
jgi:DNA invertase Pin-like site-specific DNA recombinase